MNHEHQGMPEQPPADDISLKDRLCSATAVIVLINILIFIRTDFTDLTGRENTWITYGALYWVSFFQDHEYYRLLTSMFLHSGIEHIFNNMLVLFFMGTYLERHLGTVRFTILYFCSGLLAGVTSIVYNMIQAVPVITVGASGAIFGVTGGLLAVSLIHRGEEGSLNPRQLVFAIFLALYSGLTDQGVDNAAHIGGFISGILAAVLLDRGSRMKP